MNFCVTRNPSDMLPTIDVDFRAGDIGRLGGNIGCMTQIASGIDVPVLHTVEALNWAYGGQKPSKLN